MANNILSIEDTETGQRFYLAKSFGDGWYISDPADFCDRFTEWMHRRDILACCGEKETKLKLVTDGIG